MHGPAPGKRCQQNATGVATCKMRRAMAVGNDGFEVLVPCGAGYTRVIRWSALNRPPLIRVNILSASVLRHTLVTRPHSMIVKRRMNRFEWLICLTRVRSTLGNNPS